MKAMQSYLTFNGNCKEAMHFYQDCLGGILEFQTVGASPVADALPKSMKDCILHSSLKQHHFVLMASDMVAESGLVRGNSVSLFLDCESETEAKQLYAALAAEGQPNHPMALCFWGAWFGDLIDKYGNQWLLQYQPETN